MLCWIDARQPFFFFSFFFSHDVHETQHTHTLHHRERNGLAGGGRGGGGRGTTDPGNFEKRDTNNNHHNNHTTTAFTEGPGTHFWAEAAGIFVFFILLMETKTHRQRRRRTLPTGVSLDSIRFDTACGHGSPPPLASTWRR